MLIPSASVVVIGSINMDHVIQTHTMPKAGQTVLGNHFAINPGGKGANQAVAVQRSSETPGFCYMIGRVGNDNYGIKLRNSLYENGVGVNSVKVIDGVSTGTAVVTVTKAGENAIVVSQGANACLLPDDIRNCESIISSAKVIVLQLEVPYSTVDAAIKIARKHRVITILDPAPAPKVMTDEMYKVDFITPNQSEAEIITGIEVDGIESAFAASKQLLDRGAKCVVLKMGVNGSVIATYGQAGDLQVKHMPGYKVNAIDTTAAGDAYTGALATAIAENIEITNAVKFANAAGGLATTKNGAQTSIPTRKQIGEIL